MRTITNIRPKSWKRGGQVYEGKPQSHEDYNADIDPKKSIRIYGTYGNCYGGPRTFDKTFRVGDKAEYSSYNLTYVGSVTNIGEKTVTIRSHTTMRRLELYEFCWRNWDFDLERISRENFETMQNI